MSRMTETQAIGWAIHTMRCVYPKWCAETPGFAPFALERLKALRPYVEREMNEHNLDELDLAIAQVEQVQPSDV